MKTIKALMVTPLLFIFYEVNAQTVTVDPVTSAAILTHANTMNNGLNATKEKLTLIERGQVAVTGQLTIVNDLQARIYRGLSEVSAVLNTLSSIKEIGTTGIAIFNNTEKALLIAKDAPQLLLFAEQNARDFKERATSLALEVNAFVLKGGTNNLMDAGERNRFLNHILSELRILRGLSYGMGRAMYWAKMRGFWKSVNPYQGYINMDVKIAQDVARKYEPLKKTKP